MRVHIVTVRLINAEPSFPYYLVRRAAVLLREQFDRSSTTRNFIDPGNSKTFGNVMLFELICPNNVTRDQVLTAANRAIADEMPWLTNPQYETLLFTSISCENQDR
jgi:hypothetical protein